MWIYWRHDLLCCLVAIVSAAKPEVLGSIPSATKFCEKQWVWNGVH
jgi:hypothetical protein